MDRGTSNDTFNSYRFANLTSLRAALRSFRKLEGMTDQMSMTIVLDLKRALDGDVLSRPQRIAIKLNLIEDRPVDAVATIMDINPRGVSKHVKRGLHAVLNFLQDKQQNDRYLPWMFDIMRDASLSVSEIAQRTGKTNRAVEVAMSRYRDSEHIPYRASRRPHTRRASES